MKRRPLIALLAASSVLTLAAVPVLGRPARAQQATARRPRIVYLGVQSPASVDPHQLNAFRTGLSENGLIDGETVELRCLWAESHIERLRALSTEIAQSDVDVVVTAAADAVRALVAAGAVQPIVLAVSTDPVDTGLVKSLARPDGRVTGLALSSIDLAAQRIGLLKELAPSLSRVLVLHDPSMDAEGLEAARLAVASLGIEALLVEARDPAAFGSIFAAAVADHADGVAAVASAFFDDNRARLVGLALQHRLPSIWASAAYVRDGGLAAWTPSLADLYRRSAGYVAQLLKGVQPADLPIGEPAVFDLFINQRTADQLGLALPANLLARAELME
jgi:putative ABC transport system substrate-binding protein